MFKKILLALVVLVAVFAVVVAFQPGEFRVERKATMKAPASEVFAQFNDFRNWEAWSPWAKLDPNAKNTFEGPTSGEGAKFAWSGNKEVGEGKMTIIESKPNERIKINLEFIKPFESSCITEYNFKEKDGATEVTWSMAGKNNFMSKAFCMFMDMDKMVGGDFEKGLASVKSIVESSDKK